MAISKYGFGWENPERMYSREAYEDRRPFFPQMPAKDVPRWAALLDRINRCGAGGYDTVAKLWEKYVVQQGNDSDALYEDLLRNVALHEKEAAAKVKAAAAESKRKAFEECIKKEEAISESELEAINCTIDTTFNMLLAAGYGSKWFRLDKMDRIHQVMAQRLRDAELLERRQVYNEAAVAIFSTYRMKGT